MIVHHKSGEFERRASYLIRIPAASGLTWITESVEGPIDFSNDLRNAATNILVGDIVCTEC